MSHESLLTHVLEALDRAGVRYMVTGSTASSIQGEPRSTHDIDLVVDLEADAVAELVDAFPAPDFYVSETWPRPVRSEYARIRPVPVLTR